MRVRIQRRGAMRALLAALAIAAVGIGIVTSLQPSPVAANDVVGGVPPRWVMCGIAVIGTVANLFVPNPMGGVYAVAWAGVARAYCT